MCRLFKGRILRPTLKQFGINSPFVNILASSKMGQIPVHPKVPFRGCKPIAFMVRFKFVCLFLLLSINIQQNTYNSFHPFSKNGLLWQN